MAVKSKAPQSGSRKAPAAPKTEDQEKQGTETQERDSPLLDLSDQAVKKLLKTAKARGYVTYDQLNSVLPSEEVSSEQIEDTMAMLSDMGINVVETEESEEAQEVAADEPDEEEGRALTTQAVPATTSTRSEPAERTDDPVRMYLREMGSVELLSREGEIAIAKRIEAGREAMIAGLCESPLTFQAIIIWRDELNEGKILLRDIIDLEATYEGPEAKIPPPVIPGEVPPQPEAAEGEEPRPEGELDDDDDYENALSLAAMEAELKPKVLETFDNIAGTYKKLRRQQDKKLEQQVAGEQGSKQQQKAYEKARDEIIVAVKSLSLNNNRIESLVEQLYGINKKLVGQEGQLMRLAEVLRRAAAGLHRRVFRQRARPDLARPRRRADAQVDPVHQAREEAHRAAARRDPHARLRDGPRDPRVPPHREGGAEGRARGAAGQEGDGGGQPAPRHLDREEIHQPRPAVPRPHPGRQHRPDEGGR